MTAVASFREAHGINVAVSNEGDALIISCIRELAIVSVSVLMIALCDRSACGAGLKVCLVQHARSP